MKTRMAMLLLLVFRSSEILGQVGGGLIGGPSVLGEAVHAYENIEDRSIAWIQSNLDSDLEDLSDDEMWEHMQILGSVRSEKATGLLAGALWYVTSPGGELHPVETYYYYPAAEALSAIGSPAVPDLLPVVRDSDSSIEREVAAWVLLQISWSYSRPQPDGDEQFARELAVSRLKGYGERFAKKEQQRENLDEAIEFIQTYKPIYKHPWEIPRHREAWEKQVKLSQQRERESK